MPTEFDCTTGPPERVYTLSEAARIMGVPLARLYRERDEYRLRCVVPRGSSRYYVRQSELERYLREEMRPFVPNGEMKRWEPSPVVSGCSKSWVLVDVDEGDGL